VAAAEHHEHLTRAVATASPAATPQQDADRIWPYDAGMSLADICLMISVLVVVAVVAKMLRAIRLLDGRVTILQEQLEQSRTTLQRAVAGKLPPHKLSSGKTPIEGVSVVPAAAAVRRAPAPIEPEVSQDSRSPGEATTHVIDQTEADAIYAQLSAEQERLKKAMGRDFQVRTPKRSAAAIRGKPVVRALSAQDLARKLERK
jgi:hypothetical protein